MLDKLMLFLDRHAIVATSILYIMIFFTLGIITTVVDYGVTNPASLEKAAIIAAILTPVTAMQTAVIAFYNNRKKMEKEEQ